MGSKVCAQGNKNIGRKEAGCMWRFRRCSILMSAILCLAVIWKLEIPSKAMEEVNSELVILVDNSSSVESYKEAIKEWATDIGGYLQDMDIPIHLVKFGAGTETIFEGRIGHGASGSEGEEESVLQQYVDKLEEMEFGEGYTDLECAFVKAVEILEKSSAKNKCIIMLSDALMDCRDDSKEDYKENKFKKDVREFARGDGQRVILVGFGDSTELFDAFRQDYEQGLAVTILTEKNQPEGGSQEKIQKLFGDALQNTFEDIGLEINSPQVRYQDNQMMFSVGENCYRMILEIDAPTSPADKKAWDSIMVTENGTARKWDGRSMLGGSKCYLYFAEPGEGEYVVTLPAQDWEGRVTEQRKIGALEIKLWVNGKEGKEFSVQGGKFELVVEVGTQDSS